MSVKRVVVDTNVVISALTAGGTPQKIIQAWIMGDFLAVISKELRQEINTVLNRSKFIKPDKKLRALLGTLFNQALMALPQPIGQSLFSDENDHFLLELAVTGQADWNHLCYCNSSIEEDLQEIKTEIQTMALSSPHEMHRNYWHTQKLFTCASVAWTTVIRSTKSIQSFA